MAIAKEITVDVKVNISDDTICRCMRLLEMWMDDNPNDRVIVERKDTTTGFRHIIHIERGGKISTQSNG